MTLLSITAEQARADAQRYREKLTRTLNALSGVRAASPGCTPRDVVHTEDKVTLYRYRGTPSPQPSVTAPGVTLPPASMQSSPTTGERTGTARRN